MKTLEDLRPLAYRAYTGTSFSPEKRAEAVIKEYSEELDSDLDLLKRAGSDPEKIVQYKKLYTSLMVSWLSSKSNCISSMITGPSKFPVNRAEKANRAEEKKYKDFRDWRDNVLNAVERAANKKAIAAAGGPLEIAKKKLADLESTQEFMKQVNKAHAAYLKNPNSLLNSDLSESAQNMIIKFVPQYSWIKHPFAPYQLTNNNAMITNTKKRIEELERKENAVQEGNKEIIFPGGVVILNVEIDRLCIKHDEKPTSEVISKIKSSGFKWSPFHKVWMRQLTDNAKHSVRNLLNIEI